MAQRDNGTPIGPLLKTTFDSILEVFLICIAGYILARKGILDKNTQKFPRTHREAQSLNFAATAKLRELWIIPIFFVVTTLVSMIVAYFLAVVMRLKKSQRAFAIAASMFMNSNSLPIALMQSLVITVPGLKWDDGDSADAMVGRALTYLVLYSTLGMVIRWSYGVRLLSQADPEAVEDGVEASPLISPDETAFPPSPAEERIHHHGRASPASTASSDSHTIGHGSTNPGLSVEDTTGQKVFYSFPNTPDTRFAALPRSEGSGSGHTTDYEDNDDFDFDGEGAGEDELPPGRRPRTTPTSSRWQSCARRCKRKVRNAWQTFGEFMTAPLWAALASLVVACIQPLQHALHEHLPPVKGAIAAAGSCSIPITLVVLGAYFYSPPEPAPARRLPEHQDRHLERTASRGSLLESVRDVFSPKKSRRDGGSLRVSAAKPARAGETRTVVVAILARMIVTPLVLLPLMIPATKYDVQQVFDDPVFVVSNVLLIASPPALTLAQITQAASGDAFERLISRTIFWSYCVVTPPSTILFVVIGLVLSKL
ncbi:hypothetical protein GSI_14479 [Ganoderma sinense ZZ0214-1]|uniref:Transporter n=1 Tax=Ganoderma sinense ZZ0214-1 TaxID=1077348 RepID=A0A2G8RNU1_9APHY|nr:hypothetical protein GSI_14479 [Ganoderma sinense ZZ0214-1]